MFFFLNYKCHGDYVFKIKDNKFIEILKYCTNTIGAAATTTILFALPNYVQGFFVAYNRYSKCIRPYATIQQLSIDLHVFFIIII